MKGFLISLAMVAVLALGAQIQVAAETAKGDSMMAADTEKDKGDSMMAADNTMEKGFYDVSMMGPSITAFKNADQAMMQAKNGTVVYFFAASWCPDCQATYKDLQANAKMFPMNFHLVVVNYDTAKELKMKYGVTHQHTFVKIDAKGKAIKTWLGTKTVADIIKTAKAM